MFRNKGLHVARSTIYVLSFPHTAALKRSRTQCQSLEHLQPSPRRGPRQPFFHPDGVIRPSRAPGSSFSPGFGPSSIQRAQAIPGPPGCAQGLQTREKRGWARSVSERTRKPHFLIANPPFPSSLVALSPPAPPLANPSAGFLHSAVPPPTSLYSTVGQLLASHLDDTPGKCSSICLGRHGLGRRGGADVCRAF
jgi:hypothetical protein